MIKRISAAAASLMCMAALSAPAFAAETLGSAVNSVVGAGESVVNDITHIGRTESSSGATSSDTSSSIVTDSASSDVSDIVDSTDSTDSASSVTGSTTSPAPNPATGISFGLCASAAVLAAIGVAVTANKKGE